MTMPNIQLNSKLVNNMNPEWDRFVTAVKLNKGLCDTNYEQLYAYLQQHEKHAAYDRLLRERFSPTPSNDPLALVANATTFNQASIGQVYQPSPPTSFNQNMFPQSSIHLNGSTSSPLDSGYSHTEKKIDDLATGRPSSTTIQIHSPSD